MESRSVEVEEEEEEEDEDSPDELRQHSFVRHLAVALLYLEHSSTEDRAREKFWKVSITVTLQHKCAMTLTFEIFCVCLERRSCDSTNVAFRLSHTFSKVSISCLYIVDILGH